MVEMEMEERLIREMIKLRGGSTRLKALELEYDERILALSNEQGELVVMRELIVQLTKNEPEPAEEEK